jgi:hypothetical protein
MLAKKTTAPVSVSQFSDGSWMATGSIGNARASADTIQYIGCSLTLNSKAYPGYSMTCIAINSAGLAKSCMTIDPIFIPVVQAVTDFSNFIIQGNSSSECIMVNISNRSEYLPLK